MSNITKKTLISCIEGKKELILTGNDVTCPHFCASISRFQHHNEN
jgi:hypothetical protein